MSKQEKSPERPSLSKHLLSFIGIAALTLFGLNEISKH
jgi:hypothetical protein